MAALYKVKPSPVVTCRCEPANANHAKQKNVYSRFLFDNAICLSQNQKENKKFALLRPHFALITTYKSVPCRTHPHSSALIRFQPLPPKPPSAIIRTQNILRILDDLALAFKSERSVFSTSPELALIRAHSALIVGTTLSLLAVSCPSSI